MISIIICSRDAQQLQAVTASVEKTIGVPYELIGIDNSGGAYGICEAYNIGAARSRYAHLCFMHEDIRFHTADWGKQVVAILADAAAGVLGVAGGTYMANAPGGWYAPAEAKYRRMNVVHTIKGKKKRFDTRPSKATLFPVAAVDGLWLCCRREVWAEFKFDPVTFPAFHFYDVDFCTRTFPKYTHYVTFDIAIEHFSAGSHNAAWYEAAYQYYTQRRAYLPFGPADVTAAEDAAVTLQVFQQFIADYMKAGMPVVRGGQLLKDCLQLAPENKKTLLLVKQYLRQNGY